MTLRCSPRTLSIALALTLSAVSAAAQDAPLPDQRVVFITGSTSGLGREVAYALGAAGDHVIVHGRSEERGHAVVDSIRALGGTARFYRADFASFAAVKALSEAVRRDYDRLDVLVNNAGIWLEGGRRLSEDGYELHLQVNYLSAHLLTRNLLPLIEDSAPARIINVASIAQAPIDFDDVDLENGYSDGRAYAQSKLAMIMWTRWLAESFEGSHVMVKALHPATMMDTNMVVSRGARVRTSVAEGRDAVLHLIDADDLGDETYYVGMTPGTPLRGAYDADQLTTLRALTLERTRAFETVER
jgi:NAD(P)-dependent dehydrogenase (short-subunit alcohol dehydrogenase family)